MIVLLVVVGCCVVMVVVYVFRMLSRVSCLGVRSWGVCLVRFIICVSLGGKFMCFCVVCCIVELECVVNCVRCVVGVLGLLVF